MMSHRVTVDWWPFGGRLKRGSVGSVGGFGSLDCCGSGSGSGSGAPPPPSPLSPSPPPPQSEAAWRILSGLLSVHARSTPVYDASVYGTYPAGCPACLPAGQKAFLGFYIPYTVLAGCLVAS
ncbi:hypothetical protein PLESTB_001517400 [Pleodorina starrii]|uniref:Uncharacterized protein n=1 Tax=Pleodorina starrii TaxID=330485 RepID=A0A9W6BWR6_9CHLO|nr:hypothetical protein PLESTM_000984400 [Pleodorina starrii]GLC59644.1 hypothetical protein PLESTB_001517400 [Pleodorina starrii]GLC74613.1 hypothetical protein PLESTF_001535100 [Pleodorina starrii]